MRFAPFLILLIVCLNQCNGTPPKKVTNKIRGPQFTDQEDMLIVKELKRLFGDNQQIFSAAVWEKIAEKHREQWQQKTFGFPKERTPGTLRCRFRLLAKYNHPELNSKLPEYLLQAARHDLNKSSRGKRVPFTEEEDQFLIEELSKPSPNSPFALPTLQALHTKHNEKSQAKITGFENSRSFGSIRSHLDRMKGSGKLPDEIVKRVKLYEKGASSSRSTSSSQQAAPEVPNEEEEEEEECADEDEML